MHLFASDIPRVILDTCRSEPGNKGILHFSVFVDFTVIWDNTRALKTLRLQEFILWAVVILYTMVTEVNTMSLQ